MNTKKALLKLRPGLLAVQALSLVALVVTQDNQWLIGTVGPLVPQFLLFLLATWQKS